MWCRRYCYHRCSRESNEIDVNDLENLKKQYSNLTLIDVRSIQEYEEWHIQGSICIPSYEIANSIKRQLPDKQAVVVVYCMYGRRSKKVFNILKQMGYKNVYLLNISS